MLASYRRKPGLILQRFFISGPRWLFKPFVGKNDYYWSLESFFVFLVKGVMVLFFFIILVLAFKVFGSHRDVWLAQERQSFSWITPPRGLIFDKNGLLLVENQPFYYLNKHWVGYQEVFLSSKPYDFSKLTVRYLRYYPYNKILSPVIGYVSLPSVDDLSYYSCQPDKKDEYCLTPNSFVGRQGLEKSYESQLQGQPGLIFKNRLWRSEKQGYNLHLTLDANLSAFIYRLLKEKDKTAAVVVLNPQGEVLSLISYPSYSANSLSGSAPFSKEKRQKEIQTIFSDPRHPLINKAYQATYPPGSIFKLVTAIAALDSGKINLKTKIEDTGFIKVGKYIYRNWYWTEYGRKEGQLNLIEAIARSNDIFFYKVGAMVGPDVIADYAFRLGFGQKSGIDLPNEEFGLLPTPHWKKMVKKENWFLGNTYHLAIGQGDLRVTPLQVAHLTEIIANRGKDYQPHLNRDMKIEPQLVKIANKHWSAVIEGMRKACQPGGTAFVFFSYPQTVAGKTGTAETVKSKKPDAWFTLFTPIEKPKYIVTVFIKEAGEGSYEAAPIAKEITDYLFKTKAQE